MKKAFKLLVGVVDFLFVGMLLPLTCITLGILVFLDDMRAAALVGVSLVLVLILLGVVHMLTNRGTKKWAKAFTRSPQEVNKLVNFKTTGKVMVGATVIHLADEDQRILITDDKNTYIYYYEDLTKLELKIGKKVFTILEIVNNQVERQVTNVDDLLNTKDKMTLVMTFSKGIKPNTHELVFYKKTLSTRLSAIKSITKKRTQEVKGLPEVALAYEWANKIGKVVEETRKNHKSTEVGV